MQLGILDIAIFMTYFLGVTFFGIIVEARNKHKTSDSYFLASKKLPWYAVGASFVASNVSTEHFIGMVGWAYLYGIAISHWCWGNVITFSLLIWIFLPFYMRGNVSTMPEFLDRRYNKFCRYVYAVVMIIGMVIALLGGILFAGSKALHVFFPQVSLPVGILILAIAAGTYTIYGGLLSLVWADVVQYVLLMIGGIVVSVFGLYHAGGLMPLIDSLPEKFIMFFPARHEMIPWTGLLLGTFSVGLWYSCANQFMVQRCLGARSEWDARMGVVMAGYSQALLPLIVVIPGIIALHLFHGQISDGDQSWPFLVKQFLPAGLVGLVLAGLASAIMGSLAGITNASSTIFTLDIYKSIFRPEAGDKELHRVGRISSFLTIVVGVCIALVMSYYSAVTVFGLIQTVFFYVAPPIAAAFLVGIIWPRATPAGATWGLVLGFLVYLPLVVKVIFPAIPALQPYNNFMHHTFTVFLMSAITIIVVSLFTTPKSAEELVGVIWTKSALGFLPEEKFLNRGFRSLQFWWGLMVVLIFSLYLGTYLLGRSVRLVEAEGLNYAVTEGAQARVQAKTELANFNLWTGGGQVLFAAKKDGDAITFTLPISKEGRFGLVGLVTTGPDYAAFRCEVDGKPVSMSFRETARKGNSYSVETLSTETFQGAGGHSDSDLGMDFSIAGKHLVQRLDLGELSLKPPAAEIKLIATGVSPEHAFIGVDQWSIRALKEK